MIRLAIWTYTAGLVTGLGLLLGGALYLGPESIVTVGLKYAAATQEYDWTAVPREAQSVSYDTRDLVIAEAPAPKTKGRKGR